MKKLLGSHQRQVKLTFWFCIKHYRWATLWITPWSIQINYIIMGLKFNINQYQKSLYLL